MALIETLALTLGTSIAKYLAKQLLPSDWQDEIASDAIKAGIDWVVRRPKADPVGEAIGRRVETIYDQSRLPDNEKQSVAFEVTRTLALAPSRVTDLTRMDLGSDKLHRQLLNSRPDATQDMSIDGEALYRQMLRVAAEGIIATADQQPGFMRDIAAELLSRQTGQDETLADLKKELGRFGDLLKEWLGKREPTPAIPLQRPTAAPHFTGREAELAELRQKVAPGRIVTLTGMGGMGKTSIAARFVDELIDGDQPPAAFPGGVIVRSFYDDNDIERAADHIAKSCMADPPHEMLSDPLGAMAVRLGGRTALLVLDGAEAADNLPKLLERCGARTAVLITSRRRGDVYDVDVPVELLGKSEAADLLQSWGGAYAADREAVEAICRRVDYLPLAVTLAGSYLHEAEETAAGYLAWLEEAGLAALGDGHRRQENVRVLFQKSLAEVQKSLAEVKSQASEATDIIAIFGRLALAPTPRDVLSAALAVDVNTLHQPLAKLVAYRLLHRSDGHYQIAQALFHEYAGELLDVAPQALERLANHYSRFAEYESQNGLSGYALLDTARPHIMALLPRLAEVKLWTALNELVQAIEDYLGVRGYGRERVSALKYGVDAARASGARGDEGSHLGHLGIAYYTLGQVDTAVKFYNKSLAIAQEVGDRRGEGFRLGNLGLAYNSLGQVERAIDFFNQSLAIAQETGDQQARGNSLNSLGNAYRNLGQVEAAIDCYDQALVIARSTSDRRGEGILLGSLGNAYRSLGEFERAVDFFQQALAIAQETGDRRGMGIRLANLGIAYRNLDQTERAIELYQQALAIAQEIGDRRGEGIHLGNLGDAYCSLGQVKRAIESCQQALAIAQEIGDRHSEGIHLSTLGESYFSLGKSAEALRHYKTALAIARETRYRRGEAHRLGGIAEVYYAQGNRTDAISLVEEALAIDIEIKSQHAHEMRELLAKWREQGNDSETA